MSKEIRIVVSGGGTGGHYYPAAAFLKELYKKYTLKILYFANKNRLEEKKIPIDFPEAKIELLSIKGFIRPIYNIKNIKIAFDVIKTKNNIIKIINDFKPHFGFLTGGYICGPIGLALKDLKIPYYLHEQNSKIGITIKLLTKNAEKVFVSFDNTIISNKHILTGTPVRTPDKKVDRAILKSYGIDETNKKTILVVGGSLGSEVLDDIMLNVYRKINMNEFNFIHISKNILKFDQYNNVYVFEYIDNMPDLLAISDCIVCRAGATTIAEIKHYKLPCILIPWKNSANGEQIYNSNYLIKEQNGIIIDDENPNINLIINYLKNTQMKNDNYFVGKDETIEKIINDIYFLQ